MRTHCRVHSCHMSVCVCVDCYLLAVHGLNCVMLAGCSCIHLATQFTHTTIVAYLVAKGQDVDMLDQNGLTPLMWAASRVFGYVHM